MKPLIQCLSIVLCSCSSAMSAFLNKLLSHDMRARPTATELLKSHPLLATLIQRDSSPKISGCLPAQRLVTKIITALADDDDVASSLVPRVVTSSKNESFSNQFEALTSQLGLGKNQVVSSCSVCVKLEILFSRSSLHATAMLYSWRRYRPRSR